MRTPNEQEVQAAAEWANSHLLDCMNSWRPTPSANGKRRGSGARRLHALVLAQHFLVGYLVLLISPQPSSANRSKRIRGALLRREEGEAIDKKNWKQGQIPSSDAPNLRLMDAYPWPEGQRYCIGTEDFCSDQRRARRRRYSGRGEGIGLTCRRGGAVVRPFEKVIAQSHLFTLQKNLWVGVCHRKK